jgi:hypothetical protein
VALLLVNLTGPFFRFFAAPGWFALAQRQIRSMIDAQQEPLFSTQFRNLEINSLIGGGLSVSFERKPLGRLTRDE